MNGIKGGWEEKIDKRMGRNSERDQAQGQQRTAWLDLTCYKKLKSSQTYPHQERGQGKVSAGKS